MEKHWDALICDGIEKAFVDWLEQHGFRTRRLNHGEDLLSAIGDCHFLAVRSATKVTAEVLAAGKKLLAVGRGGAGMDGIDSEAAAELGIVCFGTPGANAESVNECTVAQMLAAIHDLHRGMIGMRDRRWLKKECRGRSLEGKRIGLIGLGFVGKWVARCLQPFNVRLMCYDTNPAAALPWVPLVKLRDLLEQCDVISLHVPDVGATKGLINASVLKQMKEKAILVNFSRGEVVVNADIIAALDAGQLGCYIADVFAKEPPDFDNDVLFSRPDLEYQGRLVFTPHLAASSADAQWNVAEMLTEQTERYFLLGEMPWAGNFPAITMPRQGHSRIIVFHHDNQGQMSLILEVIAKFANVAGAENRRLAPGKAAYTAVEIDNGAGAELIAQINKIPGVLRVHQV
jgi:D-3-phosphoglycerate dehydrogenase